MRIDWKGIEKAKVTLSIRGRIHADMLFGLIPISQAFKSSKSFLSIFWKGGEQLKINNWILFFTLLIITSLVILQNSVQGKTISAQDTSKEVSKFNLHAPMVVEEFNPASKRVSIRFEWFRIEANCSHMTLL